MPSRLSACIIHRHPLVLSATAPTCSIMLGSLSPRLLCQLPKQQVAKFATQQHRSTYLACVFLPYLVLYHTFSVLVSYFLFCVILSFLFYLHRSALLSHFTCVKFSCGLLFVFVHITVIFFVAACPHSSRSVCPFLSQSALIVCRSLLFLWSTRKLLF